MSKVISFVLEDGSVIVHPDIQFPDIVWTRTGHDIVRLLANDVEMIDVAAATRAPGLALPVKMG
jgi:hypothetical protein